MSLDYLHRLFDKSFKKRLLKTSGRNFLGRICVFHQGGGRLTLYRPVDLFRRVNLFARVVRIHKDSRRSSLVALLIYANGLVSSILAVEGLALGAIIFSGTLLPKKSKIPFNNGSAIPVRLVNLFSIVSSVEIVPGQGFKLFRAAGVSATVVAKDLSRATIKAPSG